MASLASLGLRGLIRAIGLGFALVTALLGVVTLGIVHEAIEQQLDHRIEAESTALISAGANLEGVVRAVRAREARRGAGDLGYIVVDAQGLRVAGTLSADAPAAGLTEFLPYDHADGGVGVAQALNASIPGGGSLIVAADRGPVNRMDRIVVILFSIVFGVIVVGGLVAMLVLGRIVRRRLALIGETAEEIVAGNLARRMVLTGDREFDQISSSINGMLERIELLLGNLKQLSTDVAHDIRTPLNRVRGSLEAFGRQAPEQEALVEKTIGEIDDLLELLAGLLGISEIEGFEVRKRFTNLDLADVALDVADAYRPAIEDHDIELQVTAGSAFIRGDASLLRRAIANLIDNAVLHASPKAIRLSVASRGDQAVLCVGDDGCGIPQAFHEEIFRRFTRLDPNRALPGHGLGLNLVAAIARAHFGAARIIPSPSGTTVELTFQLAEIGGAHAIEVMREARHGQ